MVYWNTIDHDNNVYKQNKNFPYHYLLWKNHWKTTKKENNGKTYFTRPTPITFNNSFSHLYTSHQKQLLYSGDWFDPNHSGNLHSFCPSQKKIGRAAEMLWKLSSFLQYFFSKHHKEVWGQEGPTGLFSSMNEMLNVPCCLFPYFLCHKEKSLLAVSSRQLAFSAVQNCIIQANENPPKCNIVDRKPKT